MDIEQLQTDPADGLLPQPTHLPPITSEPLAGARTYTGLSYALIPGYRAVTMDLYVPEYLPEKASPPPVVMWLHGGAWTEGDRRYVPRHWPPRLLFRSCIEAGVAVATVDYRHLREAPFPACVHDVHAALRYLAGYADELGIDAARMGVWGESAGAHLAWLAALVRADEAPGGIDLTGRTGLTGPRPRPRALVSWYGPSSLDRFVDEWPGAPPLDPVPGLLQALSPLTQVRRDAPATLIMHGCADTIVPVEHAHRLHEAMRRAGAASTLRIVPGAEHCFLGYPIEPLIHEALGFLLQHLASG